MKRPFIKTRQSTLRQIFSLRLLLLLCVFSLLMSTFILMSYRHQTDSFNRAALSNTLSHLVPRIKDQQQFGADDDSNHLLSILEWSGLLNLREPQRHDKLQAFFAAQSANMGVDGLVITSNIDGKLIFDYWSNSEHPRLDNVFSVTQQLWYDEPHAVLYSVLKKQAQAPDYNGLNIFFFKAWDSALLSRLSFPDTTSYLSLGNRPLLSSAGSLALQEFSSAENGYMRLRMDNVQYHQDSIVMSEVQTLGGSSEPLILTIRAEEKSSLPVYLILSVSFAFIVLFGLMLFLFFGRWLRQLGSRLDGLSQAALSFRGKADHVVSEEIRQLLKDSDGGKKDQVSMLTKELSSRRRAAYLSANDGLVAGCRD